MALAPVLIKRYARSRLYDTARGRYVTIDELRQWWRGRARWFFRCRSSALRWMRAGSSLLRRQDRARRK